MSSTHPEISVVIPVYNEAKSLDPLSVRLSAALANCNESFEIIFINDGSQDGSLEKIRSLCAETKNYRALSLSRNFGKEVAITAGLDQARGDAVIIMDADLQHPPELIIQFIERWRQGYKNVYGQRLDRATDPRIRAIFTKLFYRLVDKYGDVSLPSGAGDYRLLDRQAVDALLSMRERARFNKGLYAWIGFRSVGVPYTVESRAAGESKFNFSRLMQFALDGFMSFSSIPLKIWTYAGLLISGFALAMALYYWTRTMLFGVDLPGFPSLIVSITFFAGVQLISLGVIGEYIARIFNEVKGRPLYLIEETINYTRVDKKEPQTTQD
ncbi:MAG: glycosyltransferase family 2 protein [Methylocystis sp.]